MPRQRNAWCMKIKPNELKARIEMRKYELWKSISIYVCPFATFFADSTQSISQRFHTLNNKWKLVHFGILQNGIDFWVKWVSEWQQNIQFAKVIIRLPDYVIGFDMLIATIGFTIVVQLKYLYIIFHWIRTYQSVVHLFLLSPDISDETRIWSMNDENVKCNFFN